MPLYSQKKEFTRDEIYYHSEGGIVSDFLSDFIESVKKELQLNGNTFFKRKTITVEGKVFICKHEKVMQLVNFINDSKGINNNVKYDLLNLINLM